MGGNNLPPFTSNWRIIMKIIISLSIGFWLGVACQYIGARNLIEHTSKGIETGSKATVKALDSVNKKIAQ